MKKKIIIAAIIMVILVSFGISYLNKVVLPTKIKSLIITTLQKQTQKKVTLSTLSFNIFKGLVLRDLIISDQEKIILNIREASCSVFIFPIFKKQIIFPSLTIKNSEVLLVRRSDNTLNLVDFFVKKSQDNKKQDFSFSIYKISIVDATVHFRDETFPEPFTKDITNLGMNINFSLPANVKFKLKANLPGQVVAKLAATGVFRIPAQEWSGSLSVQNLAPKELAVYFKKSGIKNQSGSINCLMNVKVKDEVIYLGVAAKSNNLAVSKDEFTLVLNSDIKANIQYGLNDKALALSGEGDIYDTAILGINPFKRISGITGKINFNTLGFDSQNLKAMVWNIPLEAKAKLRDFTNPSLEVNVSSGFDLNILQKVLKDEFKLSALTNVKGQAKLSLNYQILPQAAQVQQVKGYLDIKNTSLKFDKIDSPFDSIDGRLEFTQNQLIWKDFPFRYAGVAYKSGGILTNFDSPGVQIAVTSKDLFLDSNFNINEKLISVSKFAGKYLNSEFNISGEINNAGPTSNLNGILNIDLEDLKSILPKFKEQIEKTKPSGLVGTKFSLQGNISDFKSCSLQAKLKSSNLSLYGLKSNDFFLSYEQKDGDLSFPLLHLALYDGTVDAEAIIHSAAKGSPYTIAANIQGINLAKLKNDTPIKKEDIAGMLKGNFKITGLNNDLSKLSGAGRVLINEGKLWQLDLFKGMGQLLFANDFANIVFHEGSCNFTVKDKFISTNDLVLKSSIANLTGPVKIGFDNSIEASLGVEVLDENVPLSGTFKDITTAIVGRGGMFATINISGTIKEPKYKFKPAVENFIKGITNMIFGK